MLLTMKLPKFKQKEMVIVTDFLVTRTLLKHEYCNRFETVKVLKFVQNSEVTYTFCVTCFKQFIAFNKLLKFSCDNV
jgi:hypothetical protein